MANQLAVWHSDHINFAALLDLLEEQVNAFYRDEQPNYRLMAMIIDYLRSYGDCVHHPREDVAYALLVERSPDMDIVVSRLLQEHRVIAAVGEELLGRLREAESDVITSRTALEAAAAMYLAYYRNHLSTEEKQVMPRAAQRLTEEDWAEVSDTVPDGSDPLLGDDAQERFATLRKQIASA
ncbi:hemerythrin domain-containing protein [Cupriavidus consociatus]|uniref:hemerythrin domain-containing protein n=1 Tax=Cupriavidus consociatus TaxID=2821357 RepID=UPI001AE8FC6E|nr:MULTISPECIES: hemerythrin domain-containing protein [unclassified Cupriavidus]MBP0618872.1 hemerythrin domain-containing protein [Cupriavidus sp. LEh25]MDK2655515.1 hemerythrin domain-containing protein [Cupriavidus sp. LEh21]